jgi:hypothetical protein
LVLPTTKFCRRSSLVSVRVLLMVHCSGDSGSPRVPDSTSFLNALTSPGCSCCRDFLPAPGRRCRSGGKSSGAESSAIPLRIVTRDSPVAFATAEMPPRPIAFASIAAQRRTPRSSSSVSIPRYFFRSVSVKAASCIQRNVADHGDSTQDILDILFPCNA